MGGNLIQQMTACKRFWIHVRRHDILRVMKRIDAKWPLLALGSSFWIALGLAGPVFQNVHGLTDLRPTLFFVLAVPLWVLAVGAIPRRDAGIATVGGFVLAALCSTLHIPLHVRALYLADACEANDATACDEVARYYRDGYSHLGGLSDAIYYETLAHRLRGTKAPKADRTVVTRDGIQTACLLGDLEACSDWVDRGYYPEQKIACERILASCDYAACYDNTERCQIIVEPWYP